MEVTPIGLEKELTLLLSEFLIGTGFKKKRIGYLNRIVGTCEQSFRITFTRDRGLPGNLYSVTFTLAFTYKEVDKLTSLFLGIDYDPVWPTGTKPFYTQIPEYTTGSLKYCTDESIQTYAQRIADYFRKYALPFYERIDTLQKVEEIFEQTVFTESCAHTKNFRVVRQECGIGDECCYAAILFLEKKWDKLIEFLDTTSSLTDEQKTRIKEYASER